MLSRKQAIVGWITFAVARRVVRHVMRQRMRALALGPGKVSMFRRGSVDRIGIVAAAARPIVSRAVTDAEFHDAVRQAFATGRKVTVAVQGRPPHEAAREIGRDRRLQAEIQTSADRLQDAIGRVISPPRRRRGRSSLVAMVVAAAAVVALAPLVARKLRDDLA